MKRVLVATPDQPETWAALLRERLPGYEILTSPPAAGRPVAFVVVGGAAPGLFSSLEGVELVVSLWAGVERLLAGGDVPEELPIARMVEEGLTRGMVEWALAQVLAFHRNLFDYAADQARGLWSPRPEKLARERTVTVLGAGAIGLPTAQALAALGFETRIWSRSRRESPGLTSFAGNAEFAAALSGADILVNLLPLTDATRNILGASAFEHLAPGAFVINAGRGGHLVERDLIAALDSGGLSGAALDVFRTEPLPASSPLWRHPRVRISPHVAAPTHARTAAGQVAETVLRWERGEPLLNLVDRSAGY